MLVDAFLYFNEKELVELRIKYLNDLVDHFVVVEADVTHQGKKKDWNFPDFMNKELKQFSHKIQYHKLNIDMKEAAAEPGWITENVKGGRSWKIENMQRNYIQEACKNFSNNIAVGLDIKDNKIAIKGWNSELDIKLIDVLKRLEVLKVSLIILTSVDRDGTLQGFNKELIDEYLKISKIPVIISGGIKDNSDLNQIKLMDDERIYGAILGKSIYENKINLQDSIKEFENVS